MTNKNFENGRSMVEMLGVLAVMGVLSVGGVAMYTSAMKKHRANEILNEASKRAVLVAAQAMTGKTGQISLSEFGNNTVSGVSFGANATIENNQITLTLSGDGLSDVCPQMIASAGDNSVMLIEEGCGKITFNADMSKGVELVPTSTPVDCSTNANACSGCQTCNTSTGKCEDNNASCPDSGACTNGRCSDCPKGDVCGTQCCADGTYCAKSGSNYTCATPSGSGCTKNADCNDPDKYCKITGSSCSSPATGTCEDMGTLTPVSYNGKTFYAGPKMNWWAAENFCLAHGKKLASLGSLGLSTSYYHVDPTFDWNTDTGEEPGPLYTAFNAAGVGKRVFWTSNSYNSCFVECFSVYSYDEGVNSDVRSEGGFYALCE